MLTHVDRAEEHPGERRLAALLRSHRDEIIAAWERAVETLETARGLPEPLLRDDVPVLLDRLIEATAMVPSPSPELARFAITPEAGTHAFERLAQGFDLGEVAVEYAALREALVAVLDDAPFAVALADRRLIHRIVDGGIAAVVSAYHDASVRALDARTRACHQSERRFRATFDVANAGIAHVALDGTWLRTNPRLSEILGYPPEELRKLTFQTITHPDDVTRDLRETERLAAGEIGSYRIEKRYIRKDGGIVWAALAVSLVRPDDDEPPYFVTVIEDVTEKVHAVEALARSERRYALATSATRDAIWDLDLDHEPNELHWGESIHTVFGYAPGSVRADLRWWAEHVHPDDRARAVASLERALEGADGEWLDEYRFRHADGRYIDVCDHGRIERDESGRALRAYGSMRDVTDRKRAERERDMLLGILGHDLRNPLAAIAAAADAMLRRRHLDVRDAGLAVRIARSVARMGRLIDDLIEGTRARAGLLTIERRAVDLAEAARAPIDELRASHPGREIRVETRGDTVAEVDAGRVAQIVSNLVGNALTHGAADRPVAVRIEDEGGDVALAVHNEGPAIADEIQARLFDPFVTGASGGRSIGLGLYIVDRIVAAHRGTIAVSSTDEAGTTFRILLPRKG